jgi:hypothetical protein
VAAEGTGVDLEEGPVRKILVAFICLVGAVSAPAAAQELYRLE